MDRRPRNRLISMFLAILFISSTILFFTPIKTSAAPTFSTPEIIPKYPNATEPVNVTIEIDDDNSITNATLYYSYDGVTWLSENMDLSVGGSGSQIGIIQQGYWNDYQTFLNNLGLSYVLLPDNPTISDLDGIDIVILDGYGSSQAVSSSEISVYQTFYDNGGTIWVSHDDVSDHSWMPQFATLIGASSLSDEPDYGIITFTTATFPNGEPTNVLGETLDLGGDQDVVNPNTCVVLDNYNEATILDGGGKYVLYLGDTVGGMSDLSAGGTLGKLFSAFYEMTKNNEAYCTIPGPGYSTWVYYYINATNQMGENGTSGQYTYYADGTQPVVINCTSPASLLSTEESVTIYANVTDDYYLDYALLWYNNGSGWTSIMMNFTAGNSTNATYKGIIPPAESVTTVQYFIEAFDKASNSNISITANYTTDFPPTIIDVNYDPVHPNGSTTVAVYANATDMDGIASVFLYYSTDGITYSSSPMNILVGDIYNGTIPATGFTTTIYYYIRAIDNKGISGYSAVYSFYVDAHPPELGMPNIHPQNPNATVEVNVTVPIIDNVNVTNATLWYSYDGSTWLPVDMAIGAGVEPSDLQSTTGLSTLDCNYLYWDTLSGGSINDGGNNAYNNLYRFHYYNTSWGYNGVADLWEAYDSTRDEYREIVFESRTSGSVEISRKFYAPYEGYWGRYIDTIHNPTGSNIDINITLYGDFGSGGSTVVWADESKWIGTDDNDGTGCPSLAHVYGTGYTWIFQVDMLLMDHWATVPAGGNISFVTFAVKTPNRALARSIAESMENDFESGTSLYSQNMSLSEMEQVVNWNMDTSNLKFGSIGTIPGPGYSTWVYYYVNATDHVNNTNTSNIHSYYADGTPPIVVNTSDIASPVVTNTPIMISADISDDYGINQDRIYLWYDNGSGWTSLPMNFVSGNYTNGTYQAYIPATIIETTVLYYVEVFDNASNVNSSIIEIYLTNSPPSIENVAHIPEYSNGTTPVNIYANITDSDGINSVVLYYSTDGITYIPSTMSIFSGDIYNGTIPALGSITPVYYYINATDSNGFINSSSIFTFPVDIEPPEMGIPSIDPEYPNATTAVNVTISIEDNTGVSNSTLWYSYDGSTWLPVDMAIGTGVEPFEMQSPTGPTTLSCNNWYWDTFNGGYISGGGSDAYDGMYYLYYYDAGISFNGNAYLWEGYNSTLGEYREILFQPQILSSLEFSRKFYAPWEGYWGRFIDTVSNPTGSEMSITVRVYGNLGSDSSTNTWADTACWLGTDDTNGGGDPSLAHVYGKLGDAWRSNDNVYIDYPVTIPAGGNISLVTFAVKNFNQASAQTVADEIVANFESCTSIYNQNMSVSEMNGIINWNMNVSNVRYGSYAEIPGPGYSTWVYYYITARDRANNTNATTIYSYYVDGIPPVVVDTSDIASPVATNAPIPIFANITDDYGFNQNNVYLWYDNGSGWTGLPMTFLSGNNTNATFRVFIPASNVETTVFYFVEVLDDAANSNSSSTKNYLTNSPPFLQNIGNIPGFPNGTTSVTVHVDIIDNDGIGSATLYYSPDGFSYTPTAMSTPGGNTYNGTIPPAGAISMIYYYIEAVDGNGFTNVSSVFNCSIDNQPPHMSVPTIDPQYPGIVDTVNVSFEIDDEGDIGTATLFYSYNGSQWLSVPVNILGESGGLFFYETFPSSSINWSNWASTGNSPIISTMAHNEPTPPYSLELDSTDDTITSFPIDLLNTFNTSINFSYEMGGGGNPPESSDWLYLDYYNSGGSWVNLWSQNGDGMTHNTFDKVSITLPADALHANFQFRFRSWGSSGDDFYVDDITIFSGVNAYALIPGPGYPSMVYYYLSVTDTAGNTRISDQYSYLAGSDLMLSPQNITFDPFPSENGSAVTITTIIHNFGGSLAGVELRFFQGNPDTDLDNIIDVSAKEIGTPAIISIGSNGLALVSVQWVPPGIGTYDVYVWVDPINSIMEFDEWNNVAAGTLSLFCWVDTFDNSTKTESKQNITYQFGDAFIGQNMLDGKNWTKQGMVMDIGSSGEPDDMFIYKSTVLREDDGTYKILYAGYDGGYYRIMYAESPDGTAWTKFGVAIDLGSPGAPDDVGVDNPAVIIDKSAPSSERYKMWYAGDDGSDYHVMYATSHNARTWTRQGVVMNQGPGTYDYYDIRPSMVIKIDSGTYKMWYQGYDGSYWRICYATSPDGVTWTKQGVVLDIGPSGSMDDRHVYGPSIIIDADNIHHMWYYGNDGSRDRIFYAVSSDGITWLKLGLALDLGPGGSYDDYHVSCPTVIKENDGFHKMWYSGYDGSYRRLMYATLSPDSIEDYHSDFETSDDGFFLESDQPYSAVYWDSFNGNVYFRADRRDSNDEMYVKYLPEIIDEDSGSWTLSARFRISSSGSYQRAIPLFMGDMSNTNIHDVPNTINFYYYSSFGEARARYYDSTGTSRIYISQNINQNTEYHVRAMYDLASRNLKLQILDENDIILNEDSYTIGTNPSDDFIFGKFGVGNEGYGGSYYPYCQGWTDDINFTFIHENGILVSNPITLPPDRAWYELHVDKEEPGSTLIKITIVDPVSGTPIPGYADLTGAVIDISGISWLSYPSIKLMAHFMGNSQVTPILHYWAINWVPPVIADAGPDDNIDEDGPYIFDASGSWSSVEITNYAWDIDASDGIDWNSPDYLGPNLWNPTHTYSTPGVYLVTLNVTDINGYWDISTVMITVNDTTPPEVDAGPDDTVDEDSPYRFDASGSQDNSGTIVSYLWDIDASDGVDWGNPDYTEVAPVHTFFEPGVYIVSLNLSDTAGNWNITTITITVSDITPPVAEAGSDGSINEDDTFSFNGSVSMDNIDIVSYNWNFGDGSHDIGSNITTSHTYTDEGRYVVTLEISDSAGNWDEDILTVYVNNLAPVAEAGPNQTVNESEVVIHDGSDTWDTPSDIPTLNYIWYFGDGLVGAGRITSHAYGAPGEYIVTLIVTDDNGASVNDNLVIMVFDGTPPTANAGADGTVDQNADYQCDGSYSSDNVGIANYAWDMDASDGIDWESPDYSGTDLLNPVHTYPEPDMYTISLNVTDTSGYWDVDTMVLTVIDSTPPVGDAGLDGQTEQNLPYTFDGSGSSDNLGIVTYLWDIDSGNGIDWSSPDCVGPSPTHVFVEPGLYIVTIRVIDGEGNYDEDTITVTVNGTTVGETVPRPPTDIEVLLLTRNDALKLNWNASATNEDGSQLMDLDHYEIYYRAGENREFRKLSDITAGTSSYTHSGLTCNAIYYYYIIAVNSNSTYSKPSITVSGMPNVDTDGDQVPDIYDMDDDNDGHPDSDDAYPLDSSKWEKPETGFDWLWVLIGLVVLLLCIIAFMLWRDYKEGGEKLDEELPGEPSKGLEVEQPKSPKEPSGELTEEPQEHPIEPMPEGTYEEQPEETLKESAEDITPIGPSGEIIEEPQEYPFEEMHEEIPLSPPERPPRPPATPLEQPEGKAVEGIAPPPAAPSLIQTEPKKDVEGEEPGKEVEWHLEEEPAITPFPDEEADIGEETKPKTDMQKTEEKRRPPRPPRKQKVKVKKKMLIKKGSRNIEWEEEKAEGHTPNHDKKRKPPRPPQYSLTPSE